MATKRIALYDTVTIDGVTFEDGEIRAIGSNFEHERVPAGGFNADGTVEELSGQTTREVSLTCYADNESNGIFEVLNSLFESKASFDFSWTKNQNASVSASNPQCNGTVKIFSFPQGATFGELETFDVTLVQAPSGTTLQWRYT